MYTRGQTMQSNIKNLVKCVHVSLGAQRAFRLIVVVVVVGGVTDTHTHTPPSQISV